MRKKMFPAAFVSFVVAAGLVVSSGCDLIKSGSPTSPSGTKPPDQSGYEPLGTVHPLKDEAGNDTVMRATLLSVQPLPGSTVNGSGDCGGMKCFQFQAQVERDVPEPERGSWDLPTRMEIGFSDNGVDISELLLTTTLSRSFGWYQLTDDSRIWSLRQAHKYLVVKGSARTCSFCTTRHEGATSFLLDYR